MDEFGIEYDADDDDELELVVAAAAFIVLITVVSDGNLLMEDGEMTGLGPLRNCVILWDDGVADNESDFDDEDGEGDVDISSKIKKKN